MGFFASPSLKVDRKTDDSEVTDADRDVSDFLCARLPSIKNVPVLSEEAVVPYEQRKTWREFWIVDPLDGTRDFVAGSREFCVCLALVKDGRPILGVLEAPALGEGYFASRGKGAFRESQGKTERLLLKRPLPNWIAARSRFHDGADVAAFLQRQGITENRMVGSALKFARLAEGQANVFVRLKPCGEWDVAAGQILLEEAGGSVVTVPDGGLPRYNTPDAAAAPFVALGLGKKISQLKF